MLDRLDGVVGRWGHAIEIGCGPGRLAIPVARRFERVTGIDVAPTMLARLAENCRARQIANVAACLPDEPWDVPESADLVYSLQVFQHIPDRSVIQRYLERAAIALRPDGIGYLHFDSRPKRAAYHLRALVPDRLLPRPWRRGIRRIRRSPAEIAQLLAAAGLRRVREHGRGTVDHVVIVARSASPASALS